jgi:hypothetical protein
MAQDENDIADAFSRLAKETAYYAAGLRPMAGHLRKLALQIAELRDDGVPWSWIGERIAIARALEPSPELTARIKTSWHQLRPVHRTRSRKPANQTEAKSAPPGPAVTSVTSGNGARASPNNSAQAGIARMKRMQAAQRLTSINDQIRGDNNENP